MANVRASESVPSFFTSGAVSLELFVCAERSSTREFFFPSTFNVLCSLFEEEVMASAGSFCFHVGKHPVWESL